MKKTYQYVGIPLSPLIARPLILESLIPNVPTKRTKIISDILDLHLSRGGAAPAGLPKHIIKKALKYLKENNKVENISQNYWMLKQNNNIKENIYVENKSLNSKYMSTEICGVYLYYFPAYKKLAYTKGQTIWGCKIGMSTKNIQERIYSQTTTNHPEPPYSEIIYQAKDSKDCNIMETILHNILRRHNREVRQPNVGKEWFLTNLEEIKYIIQEISKIKLVILSIED